MVPGRKGREKASRNQAQIGLRLGVPEGFLTLIQQNAALLFGDIPDLKPVWLSGAISQLKMTANSTYCEAKLCSYGLGVAVWGGRGKKGGFGGVVIYWGHVDKIWMPDAHRGAICMNEDSGRSCRGQQRINLFFQQATKACNIPARLRERDKNISSTLFPDYQLIPFQFREKGLVKLHQLSALDAAFLFTYDFKE
jgi:hypothetical protein